MLDFFHKPRINNRKRKAQNKEVNSNLAFILMKISLKTYSKGRFMCDKCEFKLKRESQ